MTTVKRPEWVSSFFGAMNMEGSIYSNLGMKMNRTFKDKRESESTLMDHLQHKILINSKEELDKIFLADLKKVLAKDNLRELIESFFELETNLSQVFDTLDFDYSEFNFDDFYKNVSPLLLRSIVEHIKDKQDNAHLLNSIKESMRIALEEEYYTRESRF